MRAREGRLGRIWPRRQIVAEFAIAQAFGILGADALDLEIRRVHVAIRDQHHVDLLALFDLHDHEPLLVEQEGRDLDRQLRDDARGAVFHRLFLDDAQHRERQRLDAADGALTLAARTDQLAGLAERWTQALPRHLQQAEARDARHLHARAIVLERIAQPVLDLALMLGRGHVDEVDHDQAAHVPQAQLAGDLVGGLQVGVEGGLLDIGALGGARRVDVDRGQRLALVDHQRAAGGQAHLALEDGFDLALDLVAGEQRHLVLIEAQFLQIVRHHLAHEGLGLLVDPGIVDHDLADIDAQMIAHRADDDVAFLIDQEGRLASLVGPLDRVPELEQIIEIPLQFLDVLADAGGAHDQAHVLGQFELTEHLAQVGAIGSLDAPRDAAGARVVRHQHQVATGERDEGGQRRALVAALLLVDLHHDLLTFLDQLLDVGTGARLRGILAEVAARDLLQGQEAVALRAVVDEGRFQARLDPGDGALVDVGLLLFASGAFDIEVI